MLLREQTKSMFNNVTQLIQKYEQKAHITATFKQSLMTEDNDNLPVGMITKQSRSRRAALIAWS